MLALIMAGGSGSRLNLGEKPLIDICGRVMIGRVIDAFEEAGCEAIVAVSPKTPMTINWCRVQKIPWYKTPGTGYIDDMIAVVRDLELEDPLFVSASDIPCVTPDIIQSVRKSYDRCGTEALSVWIPSALVRACRESMPYRETVDGIESCPAGLNILRGDRIDAEQIETRLLLDEPRLALNVNTRKDRAAAELLLRTGCSESVS